MNEILNTEYVYSRTNEIELPAFGPASTSQFAAEISDSNGNIYLWILEPQDRAEGRGQYGAGALWNGEKEGAFRDAVEAVATEMFYGPDSEAPQDEDFILSFDPGSDQMQSYEVQRP
jgi:hypothetical protein